ncbi:hypothetical protein [Sulfuriroseicoccus oceanibius]|uniref:Uncharacterized protein n=1 Tax=Sulfuriroseicoccus oceanibius TaxID=2707525 RepID=A0A7T7F3D3_9BACT|nr:hypothetical protein [Sulfuriroseicoccus oceanibius]QQL45889.1 hypothetical protein G3M56_004720 [Sulfuriroseicoccus oceanibius]
MMMQVVGAIALGAGGFVAGRMTADGGSAGGAPAPVLAREVEAVTKVIVESGPSVAPAVVDAPRNTVIPVVEAKERAVVLPSDALSLLSSVQVRVPQGRLFENNDPAEAALGIVDQEKAELQQAFRKALAEVKAAEAGATNFIPEDGGVTMLTVSPTPAARNRLRAEFASRASEILGDERGKAFVAIKGGDALFGAGDMEKNYMIEETDTGYRISVMEGDDRRVLIGDSVPETLRHITDVAGLDPNPVPQVDDE